MRLELTDLTAAHPGHPPVLHGVSLTLAAGEIGALMGPSGSGKSTLLRLVAGLHAPLEGTVTGDGVTLSDARRVLPPAKRGIGLVFQDLALLPHRTVAGNIAFGLFRWPRTEARARVASLLTLVGLEGFAARYPHQLSGGQRQRVALARALAPKPRLLLLDEPFSSLDENLRERLCREVRGWLQREGVGGLAVTHSEAEAFALACRVGVLNAGRLEQWDTPEALYHRPASPFVAGFIGDGVLLAGVHAGGGRVDLPGLGFVEAATTEVSLPNGSVRVLLRPDDLCPDARLPPTATVTERVFRGGEILYRLRLDQAQGPGNVPPAPEVLARAPSRLAMDNGPESQHQHASDTNTNAGFAVGSRVGLRLTRRPVVAFPGSPPVSSPPNIF